MLQDGWQCSEVRLELKQISGQISSAKLHFLRTTRGYILFPRTDVLRPLFSRHFWDIQQRSARKIGKIATKGTNYSKEDVVWHAWHAICEVYFPGEPTVANGPSFDIEREAYRGLPPDNPEDQVPDVVVVRCTNITAQPGAPPTAATERDILWVECKAPDMDQPNEWNRVLSQVVVRLNSAHPTRMVYVILAIGLKWMPFIWDPQGSLNLQMRSLVVLKHNRRDTWSVDSRIYGAPVQGQTHVVNVNNQWIVDTTRAYTLDFWTLHPQTRQPQYLQDMMMLEACCTAMLNTVFVGVNPPSF